MSLVNDALRKARLEAARQEADRTGAILPTLGQVRQEPRRPRIPWAPIVAATFIVALITLLLVVFLGGEPDAPAAAQATLGADAGAPADARAGGHSEAPPVAQSDARERGGSQVQAEVRASAPAGGEADARQPTPQGELVGAEAPATDSTATQSTATESTASSPPATEAERVPRSASSTPVPSIERQRGATREARRSDPPSNAGTPATRSASEAGETVTQRSTPPSSAATGPEARAARSPAEPSPTPETATAPASTGAPSEIESFVRQATIQGIGTFSLDGIAWSSDRPFALVNGEVVGPGGSIGGAAVIEVNRESIVLERYDRRFRLTLR